MDWPADDELLDDDLGVEICTVAYYGNGQDVPMRPSPPQKPALANLLAVAEERFQRDFWAKDLLDALALATTDLRPDEIVAAAAEYLLAPEVSELLDRASIFGSLNELAGAVEPLRNEAKRELARRASRNSTPAEPVLDIDQRLAAGLVVHGLLLRWAADPAAPGSRSAWSHSRLLHYASDVLLRTPVADYLLVASAEVPGERYDAAMAELARLDPDLSCDGSELTGPR